MTGLRGRRARKVCIERARAGGARAEIVEAMPLMTTAEGRDARRTILSAWRLDLA